MTAETAATASPSPPHADLELKKVDTDSRRTSDLKESSSASQLADTKPETEQRYDDLEEAPEHDPEAAKELPADDDDFVDGSFYGWVVVICVCMQSMALWGMNTSFGVFYSFYLAYDFFPDASAIAYGFVGGLSIGVAFLIAPLSNYVTSLFGPKPFMWVGVFFVVLGQIFAGISHELWELALTQIRFPRTCDCFTDSYIVYGVMFGIGMGLLFTPSITFISQWHRRRRGLANGIAAMGSGIGALCWSLETRAAIQNLSLKLAFIINAMVCLALLVPSTFLLRGRSKQIHATYAPLRLSLLRNLGFACVSIYAFFSILGYIICIFSVAAYATKGLGLTQTEGATIQALLAAGQIVGRPMMGFLLDLWGPMNGTILVSIYTSLFILLLWMFAHDYSSLAAFAFLNGMTGGIVFAAIGPLSAEVLSLQDLGSALCIIWLVAVAPSTCAEAIAEAFAIYSRNSLGRTGENAYLISIGFAGGCYAMAGLVLYVAKRQVQGSWHPLVKC